MRALPFAATDALVRDGSRLGRVILMRFDPASLDDETRARSADGVLAYSAVCTHQGCEVSEWDANGGAMFCFCHFSKFDPLKAGAVTTLFQLVTDPRLNHRVEVTSGVRADECAAELSAFFKRLRSGPTYPV